MNRNQYDTGLEERLKLKLEVVPTLKGHKSELQALSDSVSRVCRVGIRCMNRF